MKLYTKATSKSSEKRHNICDIFRRRRPLDCRRLSGKRTANNDPKDKPGRQGKIPWASTGQRPDLRPTRHQKSDGFPEAGAERRHGVRGAAVEPPGKRGVWGAKPTAKVAAEKTLAAGEASRGETARASTGQRGTKRRRPKGTARPAPGRAKRGGHGRAARGSRGPWGPGPPPRDTMTKRTTTRTKHPPIMITRSGACRSKSSHWPAEGWRTSPAKPARKEYREAETTRGRRDAAGHKRMTP